ncbi:MAG TPA: hypothetical protein VF707_08665 [Ardenticatenaceae bacterium]|jgi:hypothetical protein
MFSTFIGSLNGVARSRLYTLVFVTVLLSGLLACGGQQAASTDDFIPSEMATTAAPASEANTPTIAISTATGSVDLTVGPTPSGIVTTTVTVPSVNTPTVEIPTATNLVDLTVEPKTELGESLSTPDTATTSPPNIEIIIPEREQIQQLITTDWEVPARDSLPDHLPPPPDRLAELSTIVTFLTEQDEIVQECCDLFDDERAATYSLPGLGVLYQVVSLGEPVDDILKGEATWEDGEGLVIGALLVYQLSYLRLGTEQGDYPSIDPGSYLVLLRRTQESADVELYNGNGELVGNGEVFPRQLRRLDAPIDQPLGFITPDQICFSQLQWQVCLNALSETVPAADAEAQFAVGALIDAGLLPDDVRVDVLLARTAVAGDVQISECLRFLQEDIPGRCQPNLGAAAADSVYSVLVSEGVTGMLEDAALEEEVIRRLEDAALEEAIIGIGVLVVRDGASLDEAALDENAQVTSLIAGAYRIDLLKPTERPEENLWLTQLIHQDGSVFYTTAREIQLEGELVLFEAPEEVQDEQGASEVLLNTFVWSVCDRLGQRTICNATTRKRNFCINFVSLQRGWCDIIEPANK